MTEEPTIITKNSNGVVTYKKYSTGDEYWYDDNGVLLASKESDGYETRFDSHGLLTYMKFPEGHEIRFDSHGLLTYMKFPSGDEIWYDNYKVCRLRFKNGVDEFYDSNGNITCKYNSNGKKENPIAQLWNCYWISVSVICFIVSVVCFAKAADSNYFSEPTPSPNSVEVRK